MRKVTLWMIVWAQLISIPDATWADDSDGCPVSLCISQTLGDPNWDIGVSVDLVNHSPATNPASADVMAEGSRIVNFCTTDWQKHYQNKDFCNTIPAQFDAAGQAACARASASATAASQCQAYQQFEFNHERYQKVANEMNLQKSDFENKRTRALEKSKNLAEARKKTRAVLETEVPKLRNQIDSRYTQLNDYAKGSNNSPNGLPANNVTSTMQQHDANLNKERQENETRDQAIDKSLGDSWKQSGLPELSPGGSDSQGDPFGNPVDNFQTKPGTPEYERLVALAKAGRGASNLISQQSIDHKEDRFMALGAAEAMVSMADDAYANKEVAEGDSFAKKAWAFIDAATDFISGPAFLKDVYAIATGRTFIGGEQLSVGERAFLVGTLFVPAAFSGGAKLFAKAAKYLGKVAASGGRKAMFAEKALGAIKTADKGYARFSHIPPCPP